MGPGILVKAILQGSFSLMVFGWSQVVMDVQPLVTLLTGEGKLHGFTHTYLGATLIAVGSALTGKYLAQWGLVVLSNGAQRGIGIRWRVAFLSAFIGSFSHVVLDSIMHVDVAPFVPFSQSNAFLGLVPVAALHELCIYSGIVGAIVFFGVRLLLRRGDQGLSS
jgi:membrane-bound metal-dependent hydrolase YbcI (DUF457 family)